MPWFTRHRLLVLAAICGFLTGTILLLRVLPGVPFLGSVWTGEQAYEDLLQREGRKTPTHSEFVFLGIDQSSAQFSPFDDAQLENNRALQLMAERPFPWSREVWALLLDRLFSAGARLVIFDLVFSSPNDGDAALHAALDRYRDKVVIGANIDFSAVRDQGGSAQTVLPNSTLIPSPQMRDDRVGYVVFFADPVDGKIRSARYTLTDSQLAGHSPAPNEFAYESLAARALEKLERADDVPRDPRPHLIRFSAADVYQPLPLWEIFDSKLWHSNYSDGAAFKNKLVIIGSSAQIAHDVAPTPLDADMHGPVLHLNAIAAALDHEFLRNTPVSFGYALVVSAGFLAWLLVAFVRRPLASIGLLVAVAAVYLGVARIAFDRTGFLLLVVPVLSAFLVSGLFSLGFEFVLERLEKVRTRRTLERYVSRNLVKEILENPGGYYDTMRGSRKPVTILFSDIIGFTNITEAADPEALVRQLNEYLGRMVTSVFKHDGTLDKFIGDAIMAVWGNVRSRGTAEDAKLAVRAALEMRRELQTLNQKWRVEGVFPLGIGIGINQGDALIGNIGSQERMDPTVIGDAVNLASRLEALTRTYGVDVLVGPSAAGLIRDEFILRSVARVRVKGKTESADVYALIAARGDDTDPELIRRLESYEEGIVAFRARDFERAKILFSQFLEFYSEDVLAKMYLERALEYEKEPPDESWNAVEVFTKK
jgi:adenylate cyclase